MKYIITENKLNNTIKKYILSSFPMVHDVYITTHKVTLGSTEGQPSVDENVINVIINNSKNEISVSDLREIRGQIIDNVDSVFTLNWMMYGSGWSFDIRQLAVVDIQDKIKRLRK